jgi:hypothetical protein
MRAIAKAMRVVWDKEADGSMVMAALTSMVGEQWQQQQRGQWQW